ncbi:hypothetical protein FA15DRAFT_634229 [Coprinopsis marcescibilis]|uniref:GST N-terminal domain-containing protein n=1 Tax=Coprinopsis marcescibilis TaxID=230819 RepID=A0A5C3L6Q1_COPMA|nr:hypothetical protein FA15DRAFT_634229 [Coprinopsis marcescibilis]
MPSSDWKYGLKLIGTPFSTFTRTIALGLHHKNIPFEQIATKPRSEVAFHYHPFGYLPTLSIELDTGEIVNLSESQAIARFVERIVPSPSLELDVPTVAVAPRTTSSGATLVLPEKVWEFASLVGSFGFPILEHGLVKPEVALLDQGLQAPHLNFQDQNVATAIDFLKKTESWMKPNVKFAFGDQPTWADFYLYPILADLRATSAKVIISDKLNAWLVNMDALDAVKRTTAGTLSVGARP